MAKKLVASGLYNKLRILIWTGDIHNSDAEGIVCPIYPSTLPDFTGRTLGLLIINGGHEIYGELESELVHSDPIICTSPGSLLTTTIIHVSLPDPKDLEIASPDCQRTIFSAIKNAMQYANDIGCESLAIPSIVCDVEFDPEVSAMLHLEAFEQQAIDSLNEGNTSLQEIHFFMHPTMNEVGMFAKQFYKNSQKYQSSTYLGTIIQGEYGGYCPKCGGFSPPNDSYNCMSCGYFIGSGIWKDVTPV